MNSLINIGFRHRWGWSVCVGRVVCMLLCISFAVGAMPAQVGNSTQGKPTVVSAEPPKPQRPGDVKVPLLTQPLHLADFIGMQPKPALMGQLGEIDGFIQKKPIDGVPATQRTVVYLGYTKTALYAAFVCYDDHPALLRSHLARRENILTDDNVTLLLDPFQDRRRGLLFQVNPVGVQADAAWDENNGPDYSFDQVWDSEARVMRQGWIVVIAIPFRSLRFRALGGDWGVVLERSYPRNSETDYWPRSATNVSGILTQEGTLHGIGGVTGSHNVQINPYVLGQNEKTLNSFDPNNPYFSQRTFEATAGGEVKAIVKDAVVFDATVNPDFSDVESDQPQFTVDQRYPVYFPELRPFFLENANYFSTPIMLLYTRNIVRPDFGGRVTGKLGNTNFGVLAVDDREPGESVPLTDPLFGKKAFFYAARAAQDFGKNLTVGVMYTDEEFGGGFNRIGGFDFTWRATPKWTLLGQIVESATKASQTNSAAAIFPANYNAGPASDFQVLHSGHAFQLQNEYQDFATGFVSTVGFYQTADIRSDHLHSNYEWYPKKSVVQSFGLETNQNIAFNHQGNRVYHYSTFDPFVLLPRNTVIAPIFGQNSDTVGPQNGYLLTQSRNFTENLAGFVIRSAPWTQLNFSVQAFESGNVNYYPVTNGVPSLMHEHEVQAMISVLPIRQITMDNTYLLDRNHSVANGQLVYESQTFRTKINYQFTRAFSARVITEYDSTLANPLETSLQRTKDLQTQALLTWLPHPGTAIYVGYNNDIQNYSHTLCSRVGGTCDPTQPILGRGDGYLNDGRQFFVKASYLFRF
jgi:hypothetical protein